jgi:integrase
MFVIALESAMRLSEVYTLQSKDVNIEDRTIFLRAEMTKTRRARQIPMSSVLVKELVDFKGFGHIQKSASITSRYSQRFNRLFDKLGIDDLNFHDLRHEAICRFILRTKFSDVQIMRVSGHHSVKEFLRYASLRGSELADGMW